MIAPERSGGTTREGRAPERSGGALNCRRRQREELLPAPVGGNSKAKSEIQPPEPGDGGTPPAQMPKLLVAGGQPVAYITRITLTF